MTKPDEHEETVKEKADYASHKIMEGVMEMVMMMIMLKDEPQEDIELMLEEYRKQFAQDIEVYMGDAHDK